MPNRDFFKPDYVPAVNREADRGLYADSPSLLEFEVEVPVILKFRIRGFTEKGARHSAHMIALLDVTDAVDESVAVTCDVDEIIAKEVKK